MIKIKKTRDVKTPTRGHKYDGGLDFYVPDIFESNLIVIDPGKSVNIPSGICIEIPKGCIGKFENKSSIAKRGLFIGASIIDCGYTGEIHINLHNVSDRQIIIHSGQKITQLIIQKVELCSIVEMHDTYEFQTHGSKRGSGGFGSTGDR